MSAATCVDLLSPCSVSTCDYQIPRHGCQGESGRSAVCMHYLTVRQTAGQDLVEEDLTLCERARQSPSSGQNKECGRENSQPPEEAKMFLRVWNKTWSTAQCLTYKGDFVSLYNFENDFSKWMESLTPVYRNITRVRLAQPKISFNWLEPLAQQGSSTSNETHFSSKSRWQRILLQQHICLEVDARWHFHGAKCWDWMLTADTPLTDDTVHFFANSTLACIASNTGRRANSVV